MRMEWHVYTWGSNYPEENRKKNSLSSFPGPPLFRPAGKGQAEADRVSEGGLSLPMSVPGPGCS